MIPLPGPAKDLENLYRTLRPEPLIDPLEFKAFYRPQVNRVRGEDTVGRLAGKLRQAHGTVPFKAFVMGHPGVGKSTEISRLLNVTEPQFCGVRLSIATQLNPANFKVFDVLLLMLASVAEEADRLNAAPLTGSHLKSLLGDIQRWFGTEQVKETENRTIAAGVEVGAGAKEGSVWGALLGLFASAKAEMKYTSERKTEVIEHRLRRVSDLVAICNRLLDACGESLIAKNGKEWLLVIEDLDKTGISTAQLQELFIQYGTVFQDLRVNMIFTIPVWLAYSPEANRLPFARFMIHDTPVFDRVHMPHDEGRSAVEEVLKARVAPLLFAAGQLNRLIVASGGNLRDLFALALDAGEGAMAADPMAEGIGPDTTRAAVNRMRREYRMKLGQSPYDAEQIPYADKVSRLLAVYHRKPDHDIPDKVLYSLLRGRAVQEFNGDGWFGVHPLVVDILKEQEHLRPQDPGGTD